jgi:hypothetical protein
MNDYVEDFRDSGESSDLFDCEFTSIDAVINQVTVFTGCDPDRQTENGVRCLVAYGEGYGRSAFFTESKKLKDVFADPNRHYPMRAVIKVVKYGTMYGFKVFPPSTEITREDENNLEEYRKNKWKKR